MSLLSGLSQIIVLSYLSHQIDPAALGAIAMMNICIYFATSLQDFGVSSFQVQLKTLTTADHTVLLGLNILQGLLVAILLYGAIPFIVTFYQMPSLATLLQWCCLLIVINGLYSVNQASLIKQLKLVSLAKTELISKIAGIALTWYLIVQQPDNLNAIILGYLCSALLKTLLLWSLSDSRIRFTAPRDFHLVRQAFHYGCWQFGSQQLSLMRAQADQLIVGKLLGMETLGIYSLAREIMQYPARFTQPVLQRLLLPRFARSAENSQTLLFKSLQYSLWFHCAVYSTLALCAGFLVQLLFPQQYSQIAILLCLLAMGAVFRPNGQILVPYIQATGQVRRELVWNLVATVLWCLSLILTFMIFDLLVGVVIIAVLQIVMSYSAFGYLTPLDWLTSLKIFAKMSYRPLAVTLIFSAVGIYVLAL